MREIYQNGEQKILKHRNLEKEIRDQEDRFTVIHMQIIDSLKAEKIIGWWRRRIKEKQKIKIHENRT